MHTGLCEKQALSSHTQQRYTWLLETFCGLSFCALQGKSHQPTSFVLLCTEPTSSPTAANGLFHNKQGEVFVTHVCLPLTSLSTSPAANLLAHDNMQLVLHLSMDAGCDGGSQLLGGALEGADELSKLIQQRVPGLLFSYLLVLQVILKLLDICNNEKGGCLRHWYPQREIQLTGSTCSPEE